MCLTKLIYNHTTFGTAEIGVKGKKLKVWVADSMIKDMIGLMHRSKMGADGMLFIPGSDAKHGIWMHNMRFPIDILWLDASGKVVHMVENAQPCKSLFNCPTYRPEDNARYVLELNAHAARRMGVKRGSKITLPST